ncbi:MAG: hypothetical protein K5650_04325 [Bacteroidales bacterium]|nr:hypothetical protein [Bacteroidales bacterium]
MKTPDNNPDNNNKPFPAEAHDNNPDPKPVAQAQELGSDEDMATAEEMERFIRERREAQRAKRSAMQHAKPDEDMLPPDAGESLPDPWLEPDPQIPWPKTAQNDFLSRGCCHCPTAYVPVSESETRRCSKVTSCNWMRGIHQPGSEHFNCVEVRFKNNRKDFFRLPDGLDVVEGDVVAVEGMPGHDVGIVSLTGEVCRLQMKKQKVDPDSENMRRLFRRAKPADIERWVNALREEQDAIIKTRNIAADLGLDMKVNDVEFQGDHSKAIFYYTADDRVDFRALIKILAEEFHVRVEMKQIGVRQEAGRVGGLGTCGRELCCSTWLTNFKSVTTAAAKTQQILPNPQKLAGQCGKLKCCLNFEYEVYADALKKFPPAGQAIRFKKGLALYKKTDVFRGIMWYAYEGESVLIAVKAEDVKAIIEMNRQQQYPERLEDYQVELMSTSALAQEASNAEFEQELARLASGGDGVVTDDKKPSADEHRQERGDRREHRDRRDRGERQQQSDDRQSRRQNQDRGDRDRRRQRQQPGRQPQNRPNNNSKDQQ